MKRLFALKGTKLFYADELLGSTDSIYADWNENLEGAERLSLTNRIDYLFVSKGKVVGIESKTSSDLVSSWLDGRLHAQMKTMFTEVDVPILMLRGGSEWLDLGQYPKLKSDINKLTLMGLFVMWGPYHSKELLKSLKELKATMDGQRDMREPFARVPRLKGNGPEKVQAVQRLLKGAGPVAARKLVAEFGNISGVLIAYENDEVDRMRMNGANKTILNSIHKSLGKRGTAKQ